MGKYRPRKGFVLVRPSDEAKEAMKVKSGILLPNWDEPQIVTGTVVGTSEGDR